MREQLVSDLQTDKETMLEAHQYQLQEVGYGRFICTVEPHYNKDLETENYLVTSGFLLYQGKKTVV